jgi:type I restriction enzyme S subunit
MREGWSEVQLGDVVILDIDKVAVDPKATYPIAGVYSFGRGLFHREAIRGDETSYAALHRLAAGQLVLSRLKGWEGAIAPVTAEFTGKYLSPEFPTFRPTEALTLEYLTLITQQPTFWESLRRRAVGVGGRKSRVKAEVFLQTFVLLPPRRDQRRIVDLAAAFDRVINSAAEAAVRATKAADALSRQVLGEDHAVLPLSEAVELTLGRQVSHARRPDDRVLPYLRAANVQDGFVRVDDVNDMPFTEEEIARFRLEPGDVLVQEGGTPPGTASAWRGELSGDVCIQNSLIRLRARPGVTIASFVEVLARWCHETGRFAAQGRRTHGIAHLGLKRAATIPVPVPGLAEQEWIGELIGATRAAADAAERQRQQAVQARAAVVGSLLIGTDAITPSYDALMRGTDDEAAA